MRGVIPEACQYDAAMSPTSGGFMKRLHCVEAVVWPDYSVWIVASTRIELPEVETEKSLLFSPSRMERAAQGNRVSRGAGS